MATTLASQVQELYIGYLGRAADKAGLDFWVKAIENGTSTLESVALGFTLSAEYKAAYEGLTTSQLVAKVYQNVLGRAADADGLAFWVGEINKGVIKADTLVKSMINSLGAIDQLSMDNKVQAANTYTTTAGANYDLAAAKAAIGASSSNNPGQTSTLTTGADNIAGSTGDDLVNGMIDGTTPALSTLSAADTIRGGAGTDTLLVTTVNGAVANVLNGADVSGIEILSVRNTNATGGSVATVVDAAGLTAVNAVRGSGDVTVTAGLAQNAAFGIDGTTGGVMTVNYAAAATSAKVNVTNGATAGAVTVNGAGLTSATITSTAGANTLGGVALANTVTAVTVDAQSNVTTGNITGVAANSTITVKGAGSANIGTLLATNVTVVDASANTGGVTATLNNVTDLKVTGGSGNDVFTTGAVLAGAGLVDAGAGTADRLVIANTAHLTAATAPLYKGFEQVQAADGTTVDVSLLAANNSINSVRIADGAGATAVTNLTAAQAAAVSILSTGAGAITIGVKDASVGGQIDTVKAALTTTNAAGVAQNIDLTGLVLTGVEKLELTGNGTVAANTGTVTLTTAAATSLDSIVLNNAGVNSITIAAGHQATNLVVDASGSTGNTTIDASLYNTTTGVTLKGGAGNDVLEGSVRSDSISGGAGNDIVSGTNVTVLAGAVTAVVASTAADVLTGGAGNDTFAIGMVDALANITSITDLNLGTNAVAGRVDTVVFDQQFAGAATIVTLNTAQQAAVTGAADLGAAVVAALATAGAAGNVVQFTYGTDSYLLVNGDGNGTLDFAADAIVKITGVVGTLDANDISLI